MTKNNKKTKVAIIIFLITAIVATALTAVLAFGDSNEGYRTITVIEIQGTVGVVHDNIEYSAYTGMHLEEGYTVVTGGNSYIRLLLDDDKYVKLESGTKAVFSEVSGGKTAINIERGSLVAEVTKPLQVDEDFIVNTPNAVLAVRGTLFRVDLSRNDKGELNTDVMTYGGAVSSKRIQPTGEIEDIEVTIKEGFKATVNMDDKETVYLVDEVKVDLSALVGKPSDDNKLDNTTTETDINGDIIENTPITLESVLMPIVVEDIPDDDLVDIYFASENGHSMFIETKEIEEKIAERDIDVTEKTSVYEVAQKVKEPVEIVIPDDNKSLVTTTEPVTDVVAVQGPPNDGVRDETTTEITTVPSTTAPTTTVPSTTAPTTTVPSTTAPTTTVPSTTVSTTTVPTTESTTVTTTEQTTEPTTEETTVHTHTEVTEEVKATCTKNGLKTVKCSDCGEIISETVLTATGHTEKTTTEAATCTVDGKTTVTCSTCGETISETVLTATGHSEEKTTIEPTCTEAGKETVTCTVCDELISETILNATGHREIFSGAKDAHTECEICYEILSADHTYKTSTTNASCTLDGGTTYVCECGYNYTETIPATGHTEKTATVDATCTVDGKTTVSCSVCTETLSETVIPATGHTEENGAGADIHTKCSVCGNAVKDGSYHDYTDEVTTQNTCISEGVLTHTCTCGWSYTEAIPASHKKSDDGLTCVNGCGGVWVDLNSTNFPDSMFLSYISTTYDADGNNALIGDEVTGVVTINIAGDSPTDGGYTDLTGIKNFTNLVNVNCAYNSGIESLDLSGLTSLTNLDITGLTGLKTLNISGCTNLTDEKITGLDTCTELTTLDVSGCVNLAELNLNSNTKVETVNLSNCSGLTSFVIDDNSSTYALSSIDLTGCTSLETLTINNALSLTAVDCTDLTAIKTIDLGGCQYLAGAMNLSNKAALTTITMGGTKVTSLNVNGCTALTDINMTASSELATIQGLNSCENLATINLVNTAIQSLDLSNNQKLTKVWVTNCASLKNLDLTRSSESTTLSSLNINNCTALTNLNLYNCKGIATLAVSSLTALETLNLSYSGVTTFNGATDTMNFSSNTALKNIYLNGISTFTGINVSGNTKLEELYLTDNVNVQSLDLSANALLKKLVLARTSALTTLNVTSWSNLQTLSLEDVGLTALEISNATSLVSANIINNNSLTNISISNASTLTSISLSDGNSNYRVTNLAIKNSAITSLDVTYLPMITSLDVSNCSALTSITGLDSLTELETFTATGSGVEELDLSANELLTTIDLSDSAIATFTMNGDAKNLAVNSISVENCNELSEFTLINAPSVTNVDFATAPNLTSVYIGNCTGFTGSYDVSNKTTLTSLNLYGCTNINSINVNGCNSLNSLTVGSTAITSLDVSDMTLLSNLSVTSCTELTSINISGCTSLTDLQTLHTCTKLEELNVSGSGINTLGVEVDVLETLDASNCDNLVSLMINSSALTSLNVSGSTNMLELVINNTNISDFSATGISTLQKLERFEAVSSNISDNDLLDIMDSNTNLKTLNISNCENVTSTFDTSGLTALENLNVSGTNINILALTDNLNIVSVDASNCLLLETSCFEYGDNGYNQLETVTFAGCENLTYVQIETSATLSTVSLAGATNLTDLILRNCTDITTLDVSTCEKINSIDITGSSLTATNITLPTGKDESIITGP